MWGKQAELYVAKLELDESRCAADRRCRKDSPWLLMIYLISDLRKPVEYVYGGLMETADEDEDDCHLYMYSQEDLRRSNQAQDQSYESCPQSSEFTSQKS